MDRRAEYTLTQAVNMVNWLAEEWSQHTGTDPYHRDVPFCQHCQDELYWDAFHDEAGWCETGWHIKRAIAKWKRRAGVKMTI
jgi:hypothetical protein